MITINTTLHMASSYPLQLPYSWEDIIFFDIETTGFSASNSFLYLIGCMYYKDHTWQMTQWLADDMDSEVTILNTFFHTLKSYKRLVHFNGSGFDIPFIMQKCKQHHLQYSFQDIDSFDIYKKLLPYKKMLPLTNFKLKTIESFVGLCRQDTNSGEDLISIYANYLGRVQYERLHLKRVNMNIIQENDPSDERHENQRSEFNDAPNATGPTSEELSHLLLLHNGEDVKGLLKVADILSYTDIFNSNLNPNNNLVQDKSSILQNNTGQMDRPMQKLTLTYTLSNAVPKPISFRTPLLEISDKLPDRNSSPDYDIALELNLIQNQLSLIIPLYHGELKIFYKNFKDYYYLPKEDMAIHKSVAEYVDKDFKIKAKGSTCYTKVTGSFLPQPIDHFTPSLKASYTDKISFTEITNPQISDPAELKEYVNEWIRWVSLSKNTQVYLKN